MATRRTGSGRRARPGTRTAREATKTTLAPGGSKPGTAEREGGPTPNPSTLAPAVVALLQRDTALLGRIKAALPELEALLTESNGPWGYEEGLYRFYHQSFKVYGLQENTAAIVRALESLAPEGTTLNPWFLEIVREGTGKTWERSHNAAWLRHTRPIVEAFLHARYFLAMACRYGRELERAPQLLPSGWAALLELWGIR